MTAQPSLFADEGDSPEGHPVAVSSVPLARVTDPTTSHAAAEAAVDLAAAHRGLIALALQLGPAGKDEIAERTGLTGVQVARRLPEMLKTGTVALTGRKVPSNTGRDEREWGLA